MLLQRFCEVAELPYENILFEEATLTATDFKPAPEGQPTVVLPVDAAPFRRLPKALQSEAVVLWDFLGLWCVKVMHCGVFRWQQLEHALLHPEQNIELIDTLHVTCLKCLYGELSAAVQQESPFLNNLVLNKFTWPEVLRIFFKHVAFDHMKNMRKPGSWAKLADELAATEYNALPLVTRVNVLSNLVHLVMGSEKVRSHIDATLAAQSALSSKKKEQYAKRLAAIQNKLPDSHAGADGAEPPVGKGDYLCMQCGNLFLTKEDRSAHKCGDGVQPSSPAPAPKKPGEKPEEEKKRKKKKTAAERVDETRAKEELADLWHRQNFEQQQRYGTLRRTSLGKDRDGRRYWLLGEPLSVYVETQGTQNYGLSIISCKEELEKLLDSLRPSGRNEHYLRGSLLSYKQQLLLAWDTELRDEHAMLGPSQSEATRYLELTQPVVGGERCDFCQELVNPKTERHCPSCHTTFEVSQVKREVLAQHWEECAACAPKHATVLSAAAARFKGELQDIEAAVPYEAVHSWVEQDKLDWNSDVKQAESVAQLLKLLYIAASRVDRSYLQKWWVAPEAVVQEKEAERLRTLVRKKEAAEAAKHFLHTWESEGKLGLVIGNRGELAGAVVKEVTNNQLPVGIMPGMIVELVNQANVVKKTKKEVLTMIKEAGRPLSMTFKTVDQTEIRAEMKQLAQSRKQAAKAENNEQAGKGEQEERAVTQLDGAEAESSSPGAEVELSSPGADAEFSSPTKGDETANPVKEELLDGADAEGANPEDATETPLEQDVVVFNKRRPKWTPVEPSTDASAMLQLFMFDLAMMYGDQREVLRAKRKTTKKPEKGKDKRQRTKNPKYNA